MKIVIFGNGATAVDSTGVAYKNQHIAKFLHDLAANNLNLTFVEPRESLCRSATLHDCAISSASVECFAIIKNPLLKKIRSLIFSFLRILSADFVYIFYPGTLPRVIAIICIVIRKPYGLYLRGEQFSMTVSGRAIFSYAKFITVVSKYLGRPIEKLNKMIIPIRPMIDITIDDSMKRDFIKIFRRNWRLLFVGRLEEAKGVLELIEAAHILKTRGFPFSLSIVGSGPLYGELLSRYGNDPSMEIRVLGPIREKSVLMAEYEAADFFVLPTHHEGFPRVLYEAMIKSMVIFTTFVGGIPGLMCDGFNCVEIPMQNPEGIAVAIESTSRNSKLMQQLSANALETSMNVLTSFPTHLEVVKDQLNV